MNPQPTISDLLRDALHYLTESEMSDGLRARQLRAEALHSITGALKEVLFFEHALEKIFQQEVERYESADRVVRGR